MSQLKFNAESMRAIVEEFHGTKLVGDFHVQTDLEWAAIEEARAVANAIETLQNWIKNIENRLGHSEGHTARWALPRLTLFGGYGGTFAFGSKHEVESSLRSGSIQDFVDRVEQYIVSNPDLDALKTLGLDAQGNVTEPGWKP